MLSDDINSISTQGHFGKYIAMLLNGVFVMLMGVILVSVY